MEPRLHGIFWPLACSERSQLRTSSEQASVMEFDFKPVSISFREHVNTSYCVGS